MLHISAYKYKYDDPTDERFLVLEVKIFPLSLPPLTGVLSHADGSFLLTLTGVGTFYIFFPPQDNSSLISLYGYLQLIFTHCKSESSATPPFPPFAC